MFRKCAHYVIVVLPKDLSFELKHYVSNRPQKTIVANEYTRGIS